MRPEHPDEQHIQTWEGTIREVKNMRYQGPLRMTSRMLYYPQQDQSFDLNGLTDVSIQGNKIRIKIKLHADELRKRVFTLDSRESAEQFVRLTKSHLDLRQKQETFFTNLFTEHPNIRERLEKLCDPNTMCMHKILVPDFVSDNRFWIEQKLYLIPEGRFSRNRMLSKGNEKISLQPGITPSYISEIRSSRADHQDESIRCKLSQTTINAIFETFPAVKKKYDELVTREDKSPRDFWTEFIRSRMGYEALHTPGPNKDPFLDCHKDEQNRYMTILSRKRRTFQNEIQPFEVGSFKEEGYFETIQEIETHNVGTNIMTRTNCNSSTIIEYITKKEEESQIAPPPVTIITTGPSAGGLYDPVVASASGSDAGATTQHINTTSTAGGKKERPAKRNAMIHEEFQSDFQAKRLKLNNAEKYCTSFTNAQETIEQGDSSSIHFKGKVDNWQFSLNKSVTSLPRRDQFVTVFEDLQSRLQEKKTKETLLQKESIKKISDYRKAVGEVLRLYWGLNGSALLKTRYHLESELSTIIDRMNLLKTTLDSMGAQERIANRTLVKMIDKALNHYGANRTLPSNYF